MTIDELAAYPKATVGTKIAAEFLGCDRYALNIAAKQNRLNIPFFFSGNRLHISRTGLLDFLGYYKEKTLEAAQSGKLRLEDPPPTHGVRWLRQEETREVV